jgi:hypothetical protein
MMIVTNLGDFITYAKPLVDGHGDWVQKGAYAV